MDSAKLLASLFRDKKQKNLSDFDLCKMYDSEWQKKFNGRLMTAQFIQKVLFKKISRKISLNALEYFPHLLNHFIKNTRG